MKKIMFWTLSLLMTLLLVGCTKVEYSLEINFSSQIDVEEETEVTFRIVSISQEYDTSGVTLELKSADPTIASVSGNKILGVGTGKVDIIAKVIYDGQEIATVKELTVLPVLMLTGKKEEITLGEKVEVALQWAPDGEKVKPTITSSDNKIAWVKEDNSILGFAIGEAQITVSYQSGDTTFNEQFSVNVVNIKYPVERISIQGNSTVFVGKYTEAKCSFFPTSSSSNITWESSDPTLATVDSNGRITGLKKGDVKITATTEDGNISQSIDIIVLEETALHELEGAKYLIEEVTEYNELPFGITQSTIGGYTSTTRPFEGADADGLNGVTRALIPGAFYHQQINVLEVPSNQNVKIVPWVNFSNHAWTLTTVRATIKNYEATHPGYKVVAAVNGDFFDINAAGAYGSMPYQTKGPITVSGENYKTRPQEVVGFTNDGSANSLIGNQPITRSDTMKLSIYDDNGAIVKTFDIQNVNTAPSENQTSIFYGFYNAEREFVPTVLNTAGSTYVVESAELALPTNSDDFYGKGTITKILENNNSLELNVGQFAITTNDAELSALLDEYPTIRAQYDITGVYANADAIAGVQATITYRGNYVQGVDGHTGTRAPRTAIGVREDGTIVMMVIDGRQGGAEDNVGMFGADFTELAVIMDYYGCVEAYNLDGGGSSTMVIRDNDDFRVLNSPSDKRERNDGNCILVVIEDPEFKIGATEITANSATINVELVDDHGYDVQKLYVKLDNEMYEVINSKATIENLVHNNTYQYDVYYMDSDGNFIKTLTTGSFKTERADGIFLGLILEEYDDYYMVTARVIDPDSKTTISNATIFFNDEGKYFTLINFKARLNKTKVPNIETMELQYYIKSSYGEQKIVMPLDEFLYISYMEEDNG